MGGDLLPGGTLLRKSVDVSHRDFINGFLAGKLTALKKTLVPHYPRIFLILGNDDPRFEEAAILAAAGQGIWEYIHNRKVRFGEYPVYGYAYSPPSPFHLKDWERYDVSRYTDPGCVPVENGRFSVPVRIGEEKYATILNDLQKLVREDSLEKAILLFHTPPYRTLLDRAALDGQSVDHVPLDVHIGSIAVRRLIEEKAPLLSLHGHVHESARLTGNWRDKIGRTHLFSAAHDGPELALVRFDPAVPENAERELI